VKIHTAADVSSGNNTLTASGPFFLQNLQEGKENTPQD